MQLVKNVVGFFISIWELMDSVNPSKLFYNLSWLGGIEFLSIALYVNTPIAQKEESWWHYVLVVFFVPCLGWFILFLFRIACKWFFTEYVCMWFPKMKKYLPDYKEK